MKIEPSSKEMIENGCRKLKWITPRLRILSKIKKEFAKTRPFDGIQIGMCLHIEPKMGGFLQALQAGGASIAITGSPGTTQDDVAMALANTGIDVYGCSQDQRAEHLQNITEVLEHDPQVLVDNGADLVGMVIDASTTKNIIGATEETTSGANRLRGEFLERVPFPVIVINDSPLKLIIENEHGVGQTVVEGFMRATNLMVPGRRCVVLGYGPCGRGVARYLKKFGGRMKIVEINPIRALEAVFDGMEVAAIDDILAWGEVFFTVTGHPGALTLEHILKMPSGAILVNAGHFSTEMDLEGLKKLSTMERLSEDIQRFTLPGKKEIFLLSDGEMINLASGKGNPAETMDMGLTLQALSIEKIICGLKYFPIGAQPVPDDINQRVAQLMLDSILDEAT